MARQLARLEARVLFEELLAAVLDVVDHVRYVGQRGVGAATCLDTQAVVPGVELCGYQLRRGSRLAVIDTAGRSDDGATWSVQWRSSDAMPGNHCSDFSGCHCRDRQGQVAPPVDRYRDRTAPVRQRGHIGKSVALQVLCQQRRRGIALGELQDRIPPVPYRGRLETGGIIGGDTDSVAAADPHTVAVGGDVYTVESCNSLMGQARSCENEQDGVAATEQCSRRSGGG